jgi:hypothetical protein
MLCLFHFGKILPLLLNALGFLTPLLAYELGDFWIGQAGMLSREAALQRLSIKNKCC